MRAKVKLWKLLTHEFGKWLELLQLCKKDFKDYS